MNNQEVSTAYVGSTEIKECRLGSQLVLAPNGDALWYKANEVPTLDLRFADNRSLVDATTGANLVTFTRASEATFVDSQGQIQTAAIDAPRFDHNPSTGESLGLLVEEQRQNLLLRSEEFNDGFWVKENASIAANAVTAPNGSLSADKLIENTAASTHLVYAGTSALAAGQPYVISVYLKAAERTFASIGSVASGTGTGINLSTGDLANVGVPGWANAATRSVTNAGNGWYRVSVTVPSATGGSALFDSIRIFINNGTTASYTGDGTSGIYIWGAQLEAGAFPTSYIKTEAATATRAADVCSISGSNFSSWYRQDEGTFLSSALISGSSNETGIFGVINAGETDFLRVSRLQTTSQPRALVFAGSALQADTQPTNTITIGQTFKLATALRQNDFSTVLDGGAAAVDTSGTMPTVDLMTIGTGAFLTQLNGRLARLTYWPARLANSTLQAITQ